LQKIIKTIKNIVNLTPQTLSLVANIPPKNLIKFANFK